MTRKLEAKIAKLHVQAVTAKSEPKSQGSKGVNAYPNHQSLSRAQQ